MTSVLERLEESRATCQACIPGEIRAVETSNEVLRVLGETQPLDMSALAIHLEKEVARRSAVDDGRRLALEVDAPSLA